MEIKILSSEKIKPATPTPSNLRKYKLSLIDQLAITEYIPIIFFYDIPQISQFNDRLKASLSETLTIFYPLAGRISMTDKVFVDCNDTGALYEEAFVDMEMSEFLDTVDLSQLDMFLPFPRVVSMDDESGYGGDKPIAGFRVTGFNGGGVAVAASVLHTVADGAATANFLRLWAKVERNNNNGLLVRDNNNFDITASSRIFPPLNHFPFEWSASAGAGAESSKSKLVPKRFVFTAESIAALEQKSARRESIPNPTRVEALTAFLWKHMMLAARSAAAAADPPTKTILLSHAVNFRDRLDPPLPPGAFGNISWPLVTWYKAPAIEPSELPDLSEKVRKLSGSVGGEELKRLQGENAFSEICDKLQEYMENFTPDTDAYMFTSWCNLGLYEVDFGWGAPIWVATSRANMEGVLLMDKRDNDDDGIEAWVVKDEEEMNALENDDEFLAHAHPIRGIVR